MRFPSVISKDIVASFGFGIVAGLAIYALVTALGFKASALSIGIIQFVYPDYDPSVVTLTPTPTSEELCDVFALRITEPKEHDDITEPATVRGSFSGAISKDDLQLIVRTPDGTRPMEYWPKTRAFFEIDDASGTWSWTGVISTSVRAPVISINLVNESGRALVDYGSTGSHVVDIAGSARPQPGKYQASRAGARRSQTAPLSTTWIPKDP